MRRDDVERRAGSIASGGDSASVREAMSFM